MIPEQWVLFIWMICMVLLMVALFNIKFFEFLDNAFVCKKNYLGEFRFILSSAVLFHHLILCYFFIDGKGWIDPGYEASASLGKMSVAIFFMISGFLFSGVEKGRLKSWSGFYIKRLFRLFPMSFVSSSACLIIAFSLGESIYDWDDVLVKIMFWFDAGVLNIRPDVNSFERALLINAGATWTLRWEWLLYFSLPIFSILSLKLKVLSSFLICTVLMAFFIYNGWFFDSYISEKFLVLYSVFFGFLCRNYTKKIKMGVCFLCVIILFIIIDFFILNKPSLLSSSILFFSACRKFSWLGFMNSKGLRRLGNISYSIFHLHGIVWFLMFAILKNYLEDAGQIGWIVTLSGFFVILIALSILFFCFLERPIYNYGKKIADIFKSYD